jgi:hypothetical protein
MLEGDVFVISPGLATTVYSVTGEEVAVHETYKLSGPFAIAVTFIGAVGAVGGAGGTAEFACKTAANSSPVPLAVPTA